VSVLYWPLMHNNYPCLNEQSSSVRRLVANSLRLSLVLRAALCVRVVLAADAQQLSLSERAKLVCAETCGEFSEALVCFISRCGCLTCVSARARAPRGLQGVITAGVCKPLVKLLGHPCLGIQTPALRAVGNIVTGDEMQTQAVIGAGALGALTPLLQSTKRGIRKEAVWTISNITAGNREQIQAVIDHNLVPWLREILSKGEYDLRKEAVWAISNATAGGAPSQIQYLVTQGVIPPLCEQLGVTDVKVLGVVMDGIENILKVGHAEMRQKGLAENPYARHIETCGGADKIERLQYHDNPDIYERAVRVLRAYFDATDGTEGAEASIAPAPAHDQQVRACVRACVCVRARMCVGLCGWALSLCVRACL
jgi:hypothetical protein